MPVILILIVLIALLIGTYIPSSPHVAVGELSDQPASTVDDVVLVALSSESAVRGVQTRIPVAGLTTASAFGH